MPATYDPIATTTLSVTTTNIDFSSIPSTYTDLRVVLFAKTSLSGYGQLRLNGDGSFLYSTTYLYGNGSSAVSTRDTGLNRIYLARNGVWNSQFNLTTIDIFSYSNTSINKTVLFTNSNDNNGSGNITSAVGLYRSTNAITSVNLMSNGNDFIAGTRATIYGILRA
jgi:hypothetical protein